jgi:hypothetical protein
MENIPLRKVRALFTTTMPDLGYCSTYERDIDIAVWTNHSVLLRTTKNEIVDFPCFGRNNDKNNYILPPYVPGRFYIASIRSRTSILPCNSRLDMLSVAIHDKDHPIIPFLYGGYIAQSRRNSSFHKTTKVFIKDVLQ